MSVEKFTSNFEVANGANIVPIKRIEIFSPEEWELFTEEYLELLRSEYKKIERIGGANDNGRDVIAYIENIEKENYKWDCYQCKHYVHPIQPSDIYVEIGKILYYTFKEEYPIPQNYFIIAPKDCGTKLSKMLQKPEVLKKELQNNWKNYCETKITKIEVVELEGAFLKYVKDFDFKIFKKTNIKAVLEKHKSHPNHIIRFGGGLPVRPKFDKNEIDQIKSNELIYIKQLLLAYEDESKTKFKNKEDLKLHKNYEGHFNRARIDFHYAEQLRNFYRDSLPTNTFQDFQDEIYNGIVDTVEDYHDNAFKKVKEAEKLASTLQLSSNPLTTVSIVNDRKGICHQLVNDKKIVWKNESE
ncbi:ABC-three component system protein [Myroides odoratus]|uniref:ABC-three component systems C-terminal domain-containing protein n=1 Tax=Myroides odoratus TaxID=256 RepID=A0A378RL48_MYROD|nr:ABC-three component system protein [Myroides odoratus]QQU04770.1 restriction endonuclease [Myroides odoratus]STZ27783.1 Uncharacterised protein [Myroides odoratus]